MRQKYFGNLEVVAVHSLTAIELRLPEYMHIRVHPVIHPQDLKLADMSVLSRAQAHEVPG